MMTDQEFEQYLVDCGISGRGLELARQARGKLGAPGAPSRRTRALRGNWVGEYASLKTRCTQPFESLWCEVPMILLLEQDPSVLEYYTQAPPIRISYTLHHGERGMTIDYRSDALVFFTDAVELREAKTLEDLKSQIARGSSRYVEQADGTWTSPTVEEALKGTGIRYRIWVVDTIGKTMVSNLRYLDMVAKRPLSEIWDGNLEEIHRMVVDCPGITLADLKAKLPKPAQLATEWMISRSLLHCDLSLVLLMDAERVHLFGDALSSKAYYEARKELLREEAAKAPLSSEALPLVTQKFLTMSDGDRQKLASRIDHLADGFKRAGFSARHARRLRAKARDSLAEFGTVIVKLCPEMGSRRRGHRKLDPKVEEFINKGIEERYAVPTAPNKRRVWGWICLKATQEGVKLPSERSFYRLIDKFLRRRPDTEAVRMGRRWVYFETFVGKGIAGISDTMAEYVFACVHIDHTKIPVLVVSEDETEVLGVAWLTIAVDVLTGSIIGMVVSFRDPSVETLVLLMRDIHARHGVLPERIVIDNGSDFMSEWLSVFAATHRMMVIRRPPSSPRYGAIVERMFGTLKTQVFDVLPGNMQRLEEWRKVSKEDHPRNMAVVSLSKLESVLNDYVRVRAQEERQHIGMTPAQALEDFKANHPRFELLRIKDPTSFYMTTLVRVPTGKRRVHRGYGILFNDIYYSDKKLETYEGKSVPVLCDPLDMSFVYVQLGGEMVKVECKYGERLRNFTRHEKGLFTRAFQARWRRIKCAARDRNERLAAFLDEVAASIKGKEVLAKSAARRAKQAPAQHAATPKRNDDPKAASMDLWCPALFGTDSISVEEKG